MDTTDEWQATVLSLGEPPRRPSRPWIVPTIVASICAVLIAGMVWYQSRPTRDEVTEPTRFLMSLPWPTIPPQTTTTAEYVSTQLRCQRLAVIELSRSDLSYLYSSTPGREIYVYRWAGVTRGQDYDACMAGLRVVIDNALKNSFEPCSIGIINRDTGACERYVGITR